MPAFQYLPAPRHLGRPFITPTATRISYLHSLSLGHPTAQKAALSNYCIGFRRSRKQTDVAGAPQIHVKLGTLKFNLT